MVQDKARQGEAVRSGSGGAEWPDRGQRAETDRERGGEEEGAKEEERAVLGRTRKENLSAAGVVYASSRSPVSQCTITTSLLRFLPPGHLYTIGLCNGDLRRRADDCEMRLCEHDDDFCHWPGTMTAGVTGSSRGPEVHAIITWPPPHSTMAVAGT